MFNKSGTTCNKEGFQINHFVFFAYFFSNMFSLGIIVLSIAVYKKEKTKLSKEILIYNTCIYIGLVSMFVTDYNRYFVVNGKGNSIIFLLQDIFLIVYIAELFRVAVLLNKWEFSRSLKCVVVCCGVYYLSYWQVVYYFTNNCINMNKNILYFVTVSDLIFHVVFPSVSIGLIVRALKIMNKGIFRDFFIIKIKLAVIFILLTGIGRIVNVFASYGKVFSYMSLYVYTIYGIALVYYFIKYIEMKREPYLINMQINMSENIVINNNEDNYNSIIKNKDMWMIFEENLSEREMEIMSLILQKLTYKEIAETLTVAYKTVDNHIQNIYRKANVSGKKELIQKVKEYENIHNNTNA